MKSHKTIGSGARQVGIGVGVGQRKESRAVDASVFQEHVGAEDAFDVGAAEIETMAEAALAEDATAGEVVDGVLANMEQGHDVGHIHPIGSGIVFHNVEDLGV